MTTLRDVDQLVEQGRFEEAAALFVTLPETPAKHEYADLLYRVWSYTERVGFDTMGGHDENATP